MLRTSVVPSLLIHLGLIAPIFLHSYLLLLCGGAFFPDVAHVSAMRFI